MKTLQFKILIGILILCSFCLCDPKAPSKIPTRNIKQAQIPNRSIKIDPGQALSIKFNKQLYDVESLTVSKLKPDGSWNSRVILNYQRFLDEDRFDLGGCAAIQQQSQFDRILSTKISLGNAANYNQAKFTSALFFPSERKFLMLGTDYHIYYFGYISISIIVQSALAISLDKGYNFKEIVTGGTSVPDQEPWVKGVNFQQKPYIFTANKAFLLTTLLPKQSSDFQPMTNYVKRNFIFDMLVEDDLIWLALGTEGIDCYSVKDGVLNVPKHFDKKSTTLITGLEKITTDFFVEKIRIVNQANNKLLIAQENREGIHVFLFGNPTDSHVLVYLYFISIPNIASFDAFKNTLAVTLSSKTYQSGLEIFFDSQNYYINYFEDDELAVDDVIIDRNSRNGIWIGDDFSKGYKHSIFKDNLQYDRVFYEDYFDMSGNNFVQFFNEGKDNFVFALGQRRLEIFNMTNIDAQVVCSSRDSGVEEVYKIKFISSFCEKEDTPSGNADDLFNSCEVTMNLNFKTNTIAVDSSNIGLIVGLTLTAVFILVVILVVVVRRYRRNQSEIKGLEEQKKKYVTLDSEDHQRMGINQNQGQQVVVDFAIQ